MRVGLDWGRQHLDVEVAAENRVALHRAVPTPALTDAAAAVRNALKEPFEFPATPGADAGRPGRHPG